MIERWRAAQPWENINEEDLYETDGAWISVRGNTKLPRGAVICHNEASARELILSGEIPADAWVFLSDTGEFHGDRERMEALLSKVLDQFEGKEVAGLKFPVTFNL